MQRVLPEAQRLHAAPLGEPRRIRLHVPATGVMNVFTVSGAPYLNPTAAKGDCPK